MLSMSKENEKSYHKQKLFHIWKKEFDDDNNDENYRKLRDQRHNTGKYRGAVYSILNL